MSLNAVIFLSSFDSSISIGTIALIMIVLFYVTSVSILIELLLCHSVVRSVILLTNLSAAAIINKLKLV